MSGRGYAERNLPSFSVNSFGTLDYFKFDCGAEELTQEQHLVIMMMDTSLEGRLPKIKYILRVYYKPPTSSMSELGLLSINSKYNNNLSFTPVGEGGSNR